MTEKADKHEGTPSKAEIIWLRPDQLVPYGNNPRKNDKAVDAVAASIREFGFNVPITCDEHYVVATGHTRLKAAIKLGLDRVPVIVLKGLSEDQIKAWRLADNKTAELATWDEDKLRFELKSIVGIDLGEFGFKLDSATDNLKEDDYQVSLPKEPRSKLGDMYRLGSHTLLCGDATSEKDMARLMEGKPADMAMTDPPYNVDYEGEAGKIMNDAMTPEKWSGFMTASMRLLAVNLKQGGGPPMSGTRATSRHSRWPRPGSAFGRPSSGTRTPSPWGARTTSGSTSRASTDGRKARRITSSTIGATRPCSRTRRKTSRR